MTISKYIQYYHYGNTKLPYPHLRIPIIVVQKPRLKSNSRVLVPETLLNGHLKSLRRGEREIYIGCSLFDYFVRRDTRGNLREWIVKNSARRPFKMNENHTHKFAGAEGGMGGSRCGRCTGQVLHNSVGFCPVGEKPVSITESVPW